MNVDSLAEIRASIDRIDLKMVKLMAERGVYVKHAAKFKTSPADVQAPARVEEVVLKVRGHAREVGLQPEVVEQAYRAMIAAFIEVEQAEFRKHHVAPD